MRKQAAAPKPYRIGKRVTVRRISGDVVRGVIAQGPIEHLKHIGEFYLVAQRLPETPAPAYRGSARRSKKLIAWQENQGAIGMYERSEIMASAGR